MERLNKELRRRERCIRIFPDENSCIRLLGSILQDYSEDWTCNRIYLTKPLIRIQENRLQLMAEKRNGKEKPKTCSA